MPTFKSLKKYVYNLEMANTYYLPNTKIIFCSAIEVLCLYDDSTIFNGSGTSFEHF